MQPTEWREVVEWIADRFPDHPWTVEAALAYFYDLEEFESTDVWAGLMGLYEKGQRFAPNGSQMLAAAAEQRRQTAQADRYRSDNERERKALAAGVWTLETHSLQRFGQVLTGNQIVERLHKERQNCKNPGCGIHYPMTVGGTK